MSTYKVGDLKLVDKFLWWPIKVNTRWHWWKKVCIMQKLTNDGWKTVKVMEI